MTVYHFEMKYRRDPKPGAAAPSAKLGEPSRGMQSGQNWTDGALYDLCESPHKTALAARDATRAMLGRAKAGSNADPSAILTAIGKVTDDEIKNFLRASITAKRVIVVPLHVDTTKILRQVVELIKQKIDVTVAKVKAPKVRG
jgi:hypothetical protein